MSSRQAGNLLATGFCSLVVAGQGVMHARQACQASSACRYPCPPGCARRHLAAMAYSRCQRPSGGSILLWGRCECMGCIHAGMAELRDCTRLAGWAGVRPAGTSWLPPPHRKRDRKHTHLGMY